MGREGWNGVRPHGPTGWTTWTTYSVSENRLSSLESGGREGIRTLGLLVANEALSQLSYSPTSSKSILANVPGLANTHPVAWKQLRAQHMSSIRSTCDALKMERYSPARVMVARS